MFLGVPGRREERYGGVTVWTPSVASRHLPPRGENKPAVIIVGFVDHLGFFPLQGGTKGGSDKVVNILIVT